MNKKDLIKLMNFFDFQITDIEFKNEEEWYARQIPDSDETVWFRMEEGGLGFNRLFKGAIKHIFINEKDEE